MKPVRQFFDQQSTEYMALYEAMSRGCRSTAAAIEGKCSGRTICVGGLWPGAKPGSAPIDLTIADLAPEMLSLWHDYEAKLVCADARRLPMENDSVDTIVYPMVLHHVCDGSAQSARQGVRDVFAEASRVLAPGGRLLLFDFAVSNWVYALESAVSGVTSRLFALKGIPLVVMHSARFYEDALAETGFIQMKHLVTTEERRRPLELIRPIIGLSWFVIPRFAYPVSPLLLTARRRTYEQSTATRSET